MQDRELSNGMTEAMHDAQAGKGWMKAEAGETMQACSGFMEKVLGDDVKDLSALGMAITVRGKYCIGIHVQKGLKAGGPHPEIIEACKVAILMDGGPAITDIAEVHDAVEAFEKS
ncbi:carboxymuconolactone decarboxylase family protein [Guyparkeria halopsychrophila]|uniref:carboxymuconolactone decarboxylase family protein n=1 Tax=Guyparkeria halopsychrophila TaxID=3139421 RepID=UPI0037CA96D9